MIQTKILIPTIVIHAARHVPVNSSTAASANYNTPEPAGGTTYSGSNEFSAETKSIFLVKYCDSIHLVIYYSVKRFERNIQLILS